LARGLEYVDIGPSSDPNREEGERHYATTSRVARPPSLVRRAAYFAGWILVIAGAVTLEFAAYMVWGTGAQAAREQQRLRSAFESSLEEKSPGRADISSVASRVVIRPEEGKPLAILEIPAIGLNVVVIEGVGHEDLQLGPGHIPETALPGRAGSSVISGHRTTYGAPFGNLDRLVAGDEIRVTTPEGSTRYVVTRSYVVLPDDTSVTAPLKPGERPRLRLTTCHPKFSAAKRLIVEADLVSAPTG